MFCQYHISFKIYSDIGNVFYCNEIIKAFNDITNVNLVNQSLFKVGIKTPVFGSHGQGSLAQKDFMIILRILLMAQLNLLFEQGSKGCTNLKCMMYRVQSEGKYI